MYIALPVYGKIEKYRDFYNIGGWQKLIAWTGNAAEPIADLSTDFLQNFTLSISSKSQQNQPKSQFSSQQPHIVPHIVKTLNFQPHSTIQPSKIKHQLMQFPQPNQKITLKNSAK